MPPDFTKKATDYCKANNFDGYIHMGCHLGANADDEKAFTADALLITKQCGVIVFDFPQDATDSREWFNFIIRAVRPLLWGYKAHIDFQN